MKESLIFEKRLHFIFFGQTKVTQFEMFSNGKRCSEADLEPCSRVDDNVPKPGMFDSFSNLSEIQFVIGMISTRDENTSLCTVECRYSDHNRTILVESGWFGGSRTTIQCVGPWGLPRLGYTLQYSVFSPSATSSSYRPILDLAYSSTMVSKGR